jgi:inhibitor of KinA sporulation pathway (predicted exonuclease)
MRYIVVDLEATCWENVRAPERQEIIEIGAVMLETAGGPVSSEFGAFVHPVASHTLSDFCIHLTSIKQEDVDGADRFPDVFAQFLQWIGDGPLRLCSWGRYDLNQLQRDCDRHGIAFPDALRAHVNLKEEFTRWKGTRRLGMKAALETLGLSLAGTHHRGIDDARNIGAIAMQLLPWWESHRNL